MATPTEQPSILRQLFSSEKFVYTTLLFMLPISVFTAMGLMSIQDWRHDALWALAMLMGGKTLQGVAAQISARLPSPDQSIAATTVTVNPAAAPAPAAAPVEDVRTTRPMSIDQIRAATEAAATQRVAPIPPPPIRPGDEP